MIPRIQVNNTVYMCTSKHWSRLIDKLIPILLSNEGRDIWLLLRSETTGQDVDRDLYVQDMVIA